VLMLTGITVFEPDPPPPHPLKTIPIPITSTSTSFDLADIVCVLVSVIWVGFATVRVTRARDLSKPIS
jgi:hypothetical protein